MNRRTLLKHTLTGLGAALSVPVLAEQCKTILSPPQTKGPFYPRTRVADQNEDLVQIDGHGTPAEGVKIIIHGQVLDELCQPVPGALVDLWQACHSGRYNHPSDPNTAELDPNFQYSAQIIAGPDGHFRFRTVIPGAYPAATDWTRPPHIHFRIAKLGYRELVTQSYFSNFEDLNKKDLILQSLSPEEQNSVVVQVRPWVFNDTMLGQVDLAGDLKITIQKIRPKNVSL
jgi:protocatechuate 3,4-dioxygenase, beta subunit